LGLENRTRPAKKGKKRGLGAGSVYLWNRGRKGKMGLMGMAKAFEGLVKGGLSRQGGKKGWRPKITVRGKERADGHQGLLVRGDSA